MFAWFNTALLQVTRARGWLLGYAFLAAGLSGCSGIPVSQDYDPQANLRAIHSVQWLPESMQKPPRAADFAARQPLLATRIERAIAANLGARGLKLVRENANAYITYHVDIQTVLRPEPFNTTFGFGAFGRHGGLILQTPPDYYEEQESRLMIDILDIDGRVLWRGSSAALIGEQSTPEKTSDYIHSIVANILAQFPPTLSKDLQ